MAKQNLIEAIASSREEFSDLIGNPPGWVLKSGTTMIAIVVLVILGTANFIKYPDIINCSGIVTTENPSIQQVLTRNSIIEEIYIDNLQKVEARTPIAYLQNTAKKDDVAVFMNFVDHLETCVSTIEFTKLKMPMHLHLGTLNSLYAALGTKISEMQLLLSQSSVYKQVFTIEKEIKSIQKLNHSLSREKELFKQELQIVTLDYDRHKSLLLDSIISTLEYEEVKKRHLQALRQEESMTSGIIQNEIRISQLQLQIAQLEEERSGKTLNVKASITELVNRISEEYTNWYRENHIISDLNGRIEISSDLVVGKNLAAGSVVGSIIPLTTSNKLFVRAQIPTYGKGKIQIGNQGIVRFEAYPYKEYGSVQSNLASISQLPIAKANSEPYYEVTIPLEKEMITDYGKLIPFSHNMNVSVKIITESESILHRIFRQILNIIKNKAQ